MSFALSAGVSGLQAHQMMMDVAGNNLANVNTTGFKASRVVFSQLLAQTLEAASQPTGSVGGTNPKQIGTGVGIASMTPYMTQGNIVNTGNALDMAIDGEGYFALSDGSRNVYTRSGAFAVDADGNLVDPGTGYIVQRYDDTGVEDGFQSLSNNNITVPYGVAMAANKTTEVTVLGNVSADDALAAVQTNVMKSNITFTAASDTSIATASTDLDDLTQFTANGETIVDGVITISGFNHDGTALTDGATDLDLTLTADTNLDDLVARINTVFSDAANTNVDGSVSVASLSEGRIVITDGASGYSKTDIKLTYTANGAETMELPDYFEITTVGGEEVKNTNIVVYDAIGGSHVLSCAFTRSNTANTWDMVLTSVTGDISNLNLADRRINGIEFSGADGSYSGLSSTIGDTAQFVITFGTASEQAITVDFGTVGQFNGITQLANTSTAMLREQDGYTSGDLSGVSISNSGVLIGSFTNGIKKDLANLQMSLFKNPSGLEDVGNGYFIPSNNSGEAAYTSAMLSGAGSILGGSLEKSNADVAKEFINLIQAQNGYQANARTINIANEMLKELTNLIR